MIALEPYLGTIKLCVGAGLVVALLMLGNHFGASRVQAKWDADKAAQAQAMRKKDAENRQKEQAWVRQLEGARNEATEREKKLRRDNAVLRDTVDGMRDELTDIRRQLPQLTADAVRRYADTASIVLNECQSRYSTLAETTDRLDSERQTLMDAWPK